MDSQKLASLIDFSGRTALVTGGTRGIGRAVAEGLALSGANVVVASRKADACAETESHLTSLGASALGIAANVGHPDAAERLVSATVDRFGGIDILINDAANPLAQPVGMQTPAGWQKSFEVNLLGSAMLTQAAIPYLEKSDHASVVNVSSVGAFLFAGGVSIYAAMKAAILSMTRSFAAELAPKGIRVNALAPGTVDTDMVRNVGADAAKSMSAASLMRRAAHPDEMVGPLLFLAGDASSYMTGQVLVVDGGMHPH